MIDLFLSCRVYDFICAVFDFTYVEIMLRFFHDCFYAIILCVFILFLLWLCVWFYLCRVIDCISDVCIILVFLLHVYEFTLVVFLFFFCSVYDFILLGMFLLRVWFYYCCEQVFLFLPCVIVFLLCVWYYFFFFFWYCVGFYFCCVYEFIPSAINLIFVVCITVWFCSVWFLFLLCVIFILLCKPYMIYCCCVWFYFFTGGFYFCCVYGFNVAVSSVVCMVLFLLCTIWYYLCSVYNSAVFMFLILYHVCLHCPLFYFF